MEKKIIDRYNIVIEYMENQDDQQWNDMLFKALVYTATEKTPEERKLIANALTTLTK